MEFDYDAIIEEMKFTNGKYMNVFVWANGDQTYGMWNTLEEAVEFDKLISYAVLRKIVKVRD